MASIDAIAGVSKANLGASNQLPFPNNNHKILAERINTKNMTLLNQERDDNIEISKKQMIPEKIKEDQMYQTDIKNYDQANVRRMNTNEIMGLKEKWIKSK
jgi:hypothetical protein